MLQLQRKDEVESNSEMLVDEDDSAVDGSSQQYSDEEREVEREGEQSLRYEIKEEDEGQEEKSSSYRLNVIYTKQVKKKRKTYSDGILKVKLTNGNCSCILMDTGDPQEVGIDKRQLSKVESKLFVQKQSHSLKLHSHLVEVSFTNISFPPSEELQPTSKRKVDGLQISLEKTPKVLSQRLPNSNLNKTVKKFIPPYKNSPALPSPVLQVEAKLLGKNGKFITSSVKEMDDFDGRNESKKNKKNKCQEITEMNSFAMLSTIHK
jgi:hypothetical protein